MLIYSCASSPVPYTLMNKNAPALTHLPRRVFDIPFARLTSFGDVPYVIELVHKVALRHTHMHAHTHFIAIK